MNVQKSSGIFVKSKSKYKSLKHRENSSCPGPGQEAAWRALETRRVQCARNEGAVTGKWGGD